MRIGSKRHYKEKPFGVKWPDEPIKALGVYFTYDQKLLKEKNLIERLDSIKKLFNIWSARARLVDIRLGDTSSAERLFELLNKF